MGVGVREVRTRFTGEVVGLSGTGVWGIGSVGGGGFNFHRRGGRFVAVGRFWSGVAVFGVPELVEPGTGHHVR